MTRLHLITDDPPNAGTPATLLDGRALDSEDVYIRCNFAIPSTTPKEIEVVLPHHAFRLGVADLSLLPQARLTMVLECAGNGRILMDPVPEGTPWDLGGASPVRFEGVPLLEAVGFVPEEVTELVFTGQDRGEVVPGEQVNYQFSLGRGDWERSMLALRLGDGPLPTEHGGPVRLVVPGHYAMKSVKWVTRIEASTKPFRGHFVEKYRYFSDDSQPEAAHVGEIQVRSVIARPEPGHVLAGPTVEIAGAAWSGYGPITSVEVSVDDGKSWLTAEIEVGPAYGATSWSTRLHLASGRHNLISRARDAAGNVQPLEPRWNRNGYANNVVHRVEFAVSGQERAD